ncbi:hypothetical protein DPMN_029407 [Dreissena polymorpha]|uniref:Uncharacterized protein n=1 Tax=Dreissena polymorpha TaxID=45954 RepID=A0A9D4LWE2_DREPO|nr:hypothetical protein DPMN_029407 [Dreissena polymorpha]
MAEVICESKERQLCVEIVPNTQLELRFKRFATHTRAPTVLKDYLQDTGKEFLLRMFLNPCK